MPKRHFLERAIDSLETFNHRLSAAQLTVDAESLGFEYRDGANDDLMRLVIDGRVTVTLCFSKRQFSVTKYPGAWRVAHKLAILRLSIWAARWQQVESLP
jgi:hypothetical protein